MSMSRNLPDVREGMRVFGSLTGITRFDAQAVADALRTRPLTRLEAVALANLIDGSNPTGLRLAIKGQGKGWIPMIEAAARFDRLRAVGAFVDERLSDGETLEAAVIEAAENFGFSEPTIYRDLALYRLWDSE
jgi:hypothetical protein